jgi:hypothetical protein
MRLPGFTADVSLSRSWEVHRQFAAYGQTEGGVLPAGVLCSYSCRWVWINAGFAGYFRIWICGWHCRPLPF